MLRIRRNNQGTIRYQRGPFLTDAIEQGRELTIVLNPTFAVLRLKGLRQELTLPYAAMWTRACQIKAREIQEQRRAAKKAARMNHRKGVAA